MCVCLCVCVCVCMCVIHWKKRRKNDQVPGTCMGKSMKLNVKTSLENYKCPGRLKYKSFVSCLGDFILRSVEPSSRQNGTNMICFCFNKRHSGDKEKIDRRLLLQSENYE